MHATSIRRYAPQVTIDPMGLRSIMSGYLSSIRSRPEADSAEPLVLDLESDDAGEILGALSSETARHIMLALHNQPATLSEVAETVDTSRQNAQYHLKKLEAVDAVQVIDTLYSEKGREMKVYAPSGEPMIIVSAEDGTGNRLRDTISDLLAPILAIALVSVILQMVASAGDTDSASATEHPGGSPSITDELFSSGHELLEAYPGLVFFIAAVGVVVTLSVVRYVRSSSAPVRAG